MRYQYLKKCVGALVPEKAPALRGRVFTDNKPDLSTHHANQPTSKKSKRERRANFSQILSNMEAVETAWQLIPMARSRLISFELSYTNDKLKFQFVLHL